MTAPDPEAVLGQYKGHDVTTATVSIRNTGHGLEEAMEVDPVELEMGSTVYVVLECEVEKHRYDPIKDTDELQLVNMLKAGRATLVAYDLVKVALDEQTQRIKQAKAAAEAAAKKDKRQLQLVGDDADHAEINDDDPDLTAADPEAVLREVEASAQWRRTRTAELDAKNKAEVQELARDLGISVGNRTKAELVDEILDVEESR